MTPEELRALDAEIAETVMGWEWIVANPRSDDIDTPAAHWKFLAAPDYRASFDKAGWHHNPFKLATTEDVGPAEPDLPRYSSDIAAAFTVVEHMQQFSCDFCLEKAGAAWYADFKLPGYGPSQPTPALAICVAALAAIASDSPAPTPDTASLKTSDGAP